MSLTMTLPIHTPVLVKEVTEALNVQPGKRYVDCTLGSGGHAAAILEKSLPNGRLLGIDTDPEAIKVAEIRLRDYTESSVFVNDNFDTAERGFSFQHDGPLDMRFGPAQELTGADIVNALPEDKLAQLIRIYGEERYSRQIARCVIRNRPINTTLELARIVAQVIGSRRGKIHPATRTFLALRIAVNRELENLVVALKQTINCLAYQGRVVVISYHSLEDRLVKEFMKRETRGCVCPPGTPECKCEHVPSLKLISKKVITPFLGEIKSNPRSRSAKLRVAERL